MDHKMIWGVILAISLFMSTALITAVLYAQDWPMFQHDTYHSGLQKGKGCLQNLGDVSIIWFHHTNGYDVTSQPMVGDINGDSFMEVVATIGNGVYAFSGTNGRILWTFSADGIMTRSSPALGDINGDGFIEVIAGSQDFFVYTLSGNDGSLLWKYDTGGNIKRNSPVLADIDKDGLDEVIIGSTNGNLFAVNGDGTTLWRFSIPGLDYINNSPAVGDIDNDGDLEVVIFTTSGWVYVLEGEDGNVAWSRRLVIGEVYEGYSSPSLGDLNGDSTLEIVIGTYAGTLYVLNSTNGDILWHHSFGVYCLATPVVVDIDADNLPEIIIGSSWGDEKVYCFENDGTIKWVADFQYFNPGKPSSSAADINGDGDIEIVVAAEDISWCGGLIAALDKNGNELWNFQHFPELQVNWTMKGPTIADVTGDGELDVIWGTSHYPCTYEHDGYIVVLGVSPRFVRADANGDMEITVADAIYIIGNIYGGGPCDCQEACDANDDGRITSADAVYIVGYIHRSGSLPPDPFPDCGVDISPDGLGCGHHPCMDMR